MLTFATWFATLAVVTAMAFNMVRIARGPHAEDRVLAVDTLYVNTVALIVVFSIHYDTRMYMETALLIAAMGFVATVALASYLEPSYLMD